MQTANPISAPLSSFHIPTLRPIYPRLIDDVEITKAVEEAAQAAVATLDRLFPASNREVRGISSNFQGLLENHIKAMLTGSEAANKTYSTYLSPLVGTWNSLGKIRGLREQEGYSLVKSRIDSNDEPLYYHGDHKDFTPLSSISAGSLAISSDELVKEAFNWMQDNELAPQAVRMRLCILSYAEEGVLKLVAIGE